MTCRAVFVVSCGPKIFLHFFLCGKWFCAQNRIEHEAIDYIREIKRRANRETSLERLPQTAMDKLCSADSYPSDSYVFSYCGYDLPISSERIANAFASLPEQEQSS